MDTWGLLSIRRVTAPNHLNGGILLEPLWYNRYINHNRNIITDTVIKQFCCLGITFVQDLFLVTSYESQFRSKRIFESLKLELREVSLPNHWREHLKSISGTDLGHTEFQVPELELYIDDSKAICFQSPPHRGIYKMILCSLCDHENYDPKVWCDILSFDVDDKCYFSNVYNCMLAKNECDLIWKIMHGAIPTGRFLQGCKFADSPDCKYCGDLDDLTHIFVKCTRLSQLFQLTQSIIRKLCPTIHKIPFMWYIIGIPPKTGLNSYVRHLGSWIFALAKISIVHSRFNKAMNSGTHCAVTLFKAKIVSRVNIEYHFAKFSDKVPYFCEKWNVNNAICRIINDDLIFDL